MNNHKQCSQIHIDREAWRKSANIISLIQRKLPNIVKSREIILALLEAELPFINANELSIIYKSFGAKNPIFLAYSGTVFSKESCPDFEVNNNYIIDIINHPDSKEVYYFKNKEQCRIAGFSAYKSVLIVPMHLSDERNIGVFVIHNTAKENAYTGDIKQILNQLSDHIAYFIRTKIRKNIHTIFDNSRNKLLASHFKYEDDIFSQLVLLMKQWYGKTDDIYILIKNPIKVGCYFLACDKGQVIKEFRLNSVMEQEKIQKIIGDPNIQCTIDRNHGLVIKEEYILDTINKKCKSWAAANIRHPAGYSFGYIILQNSTVKHAYEYGDEHILDNIANFTAVLLAEHRKEKRYDFIKQINHSTDNPYKENTTYKKIYHFFEKNYGINCLEIAIQNRKKQKLQTVFKRGHKALNFNTKDYQTIEKHIHSLRNNRDTNAENLSLTICSSTYLVTPMRIVSETGIWQVIGCFIIPIQHIGNITAKSINKVSDAIAVRVNHWNNYQRNEILNEFGKTVSQLSTKNINYNKLLNLAYKAVAKVMFTENFYIALYDIEKNKIQFPFILKEGEEWVVEPRLLNPHKIGKTEEIILSQQPLLHLTNQDSKHWYTDPDHPERYEFAGNYLASWVGVPIFSADGVIGVIATYHASANYLYTEDDIFFLQNIAHSISGLFRVLSEAKIINKIQEIQQQQREKERAEKRRVRELEREKQEAIQKVKQQEKQKSEEKKQIYIAEQQDIISTSLLAQDLTHRLNNSIGIIKVSVEQAIRDISLTHSGAGIDHLRRTKQSLSNIDEVIDEVIDEISEISNESLQVISLRDVADKVLRQVYISKRLEHENIQPNLEVMDDVPDNIEANARTFFNSLYAVVDNAATAVLAKKSQSPLINNFFVSVHISQDAGHIFIDVSDNGIAIEESRKKEIFQVNPNAGNYSRYGLWRARNIMESLGGKLELLDTDRKTFRFSLVKKEKTPPQEPQQINNLVYILDDEISWRDQIGWWLEDANFAVKKAANMEEMDSLLNAVHSPQLVLLDISLYKREGRNLDGLSFIEKIRLKYPKTKICIVTGYSEFLGDYKNSVDYVFKKIDNKTRIVLNQDYFTTKINQLIKYGTL